MANAACPEIYNHQITTLQGEKINLCDYQDKPILVVNTASKCGFTPQFEALEGLYSKNKDKGLLVIGFPSNDFRQDPGDNKAIGDFCKMTYGVSKEGAVENYEKALKLNPESAVARTEMADGLYKLFGDKKMKEVEALYAEAAASEPKDAMECLDVAAAKAEMED